MKRCQQADHKSEEAISWNITLDLSDIDGIHLLGCRLYIVLLLLQLYSLGMPTKCDYAAKYWHMKPRFPV